MTPNRLVNPSNGDHIADVARALSPVRVLKGETVLAESADAIILSEMIGERRLADVYYVPLPDVSQALKPVAGKSTHCPLKGDASYLSFEGEDVAWIYDRPIAGAEWLKQYAGFYTDRTTLVT